MFVMQCRDGGWEKGEFVTDLCLIDLYRLSEGNSIQGVKYGIYLLGFCVPG